MSLFQHVPFKNFTPSRSPHYIKGHSKRQVQKIRNLQLYYYRLKQAKETCSKLNEKLNSSFPKNIKIFKAFNEDIYHLMRVVSSQIKQEGQTIDKLK